MTKIDHRAKVKVIMNNTPETHQSSSQIEALSDDERALYSIDALEQWRSHQMDDWIEHLTGELEAGKEYSEIVREYDALADKRLDTYLGGHGLVADDAPNYREVASLFRDASIEAIRNDDWYVSSEAPDGTRQLSPRDVFMKRIEVRLELDADDTEDDEDSPEGERTLDVIKAELDAAKVCLSKMDAKRWGRVKDRRIRGYLAARDEYNTLKVEYGQKLLQDEIEQLSTPEEKNLRVLKYLLEQDNELGDLTRAELNSTRIGKFVRWMNKGGRVARVAKGVLLGAPAGAIGVASLFIPGVNVLMGGAIAGTVAAGVAAGSRFARGYAMHANYDGEKHRVDTSDEALQDTAASVSGATTEESFAQGRQISEQKHEEIVKQEHRDRLKSLSLGLGSVALGAVATYGGGWAVSKLPSSWAPSWSWLDKVRHVYDRSGGDVKKPNRNILDMFDDAREKMGGRGGSGVISDVPSTVHDGAMPSGVDRIVEAFSGDATLIEYGEGGWNTLSEMGVDSAHYEAVWEAVGQRLTDSGHGDLVYRMPDGQWGWSRPGVLDGEALRVIAEVIDQSK